MREPEDHLSSAEIDAILLPTGSEDIVQDAVRHLVACNNCQSTLDMHRAEQNRLEQLRSRAPAERRSECPADIEWLRVGAGLLEVADAEALVRHAAECDHCGPLLRAVVADLSDELTPDEETFVGKLESSRPDWQRRLVSEMCEPQSGATRGSHAGEVVRPTPRWSHFANIPVWVYGSAVAALALLTIFSVRFLRPTPVENLLAIAYTEQRTLELRIPNAAHAPVRLTRGSSSRLDRPAPLLEAQARIARELQHGPSTPELLQAMGQADLLDWNYEAALRSFRRGLDLAPGRPGLMRDLASAYFQRAEANQHRTSDYAVALSLLDQVLRSNPDDPIALFNRAIVLERMDLDSKAIEDWRHYSNVERNSEWASEAKARLDKLEQKNTKDTNQK